MNNRFDSGYILLAVLLCFLVVSLLAYRTMEHWQEKNDLGHGFSEEDALLALPQFRLVDTSGLLLPTFVDKTLGNRSGSYPYVVLAGSFFSKDKAKIHLIYLRKLGLPLAELLHFDGQRDIHAIGVGKHEHLKDAKAQVKALKQEYGVEAYVHKVRQTP